MKTLWDLKKNQDYPQCHDSKKTCSLLMGLLGSTNFDKSYSKSSNVFGPNGSMALSGY